jgi:hypothetical protein
MPPVPPVPPAPPMPSVPHNGSTIDQAVAGATDDPLCGTRVAEDRVRSPVHPPGGTSWCSSGAAPAGTIHRTAAMRLIGITRRVRDRQPTAPTTPR